MRRSPSRPHRAQDRKRATQAAPDRARPPRVPRRNAEAADRARPPRARRLAARRVGRRAEILLPQLRDRRPGLSVLERRMSENQKRTTAAYRENWHAIWGTKVKPKTREKALPRKRSAAALALQSPTHRHRVIPDERRKVSEREAKKEIDGALCPICRRPKRANCEDGWLPPIGPCSDDSYITSRPCPNA
jgi:hypothetical protein